MRIKNFWLGLLVLLALVPACARAPAQVNVALDQTFALAIGQSATVQGQDLKILFKGVVSDSRCPQGAT